MICFVDIVPVNPLKHMDMANYLKYTKQILNKMSFCPQLLNKEYHKCVALLTRKECQRLHNWIRRQDFSTKLEIQLT